MGAPGAMSAGRASPGASDPERPDFREALRPRSCAGGQYPALPTHRQAWGAFGPADGHIAWAIGGRALPPSGAPLQRFLDYRGRSRHRSQRPAPRRMQPGQGCPGDRTRRTGADMFTGLVQATGRVRSATSTPSGRRLEVDLGDWTHRPTEGSSSGTPCSRSYREPFASSITSCSSCPRSTTP